MRVKASSAPSGSSKASTRGWLTVRGPAPRAASVRPTAPPAIASACQRDRPHKRAFRARLAHSANSARGETDFYIRQHRAPMAASRGSWNITRMSSGRASSPRLIVPAVMVSRPAINRSKVLLAAAAAANDRNRLAGGNVQVDAAQHLIVTEGFAQPRWSAKAPGLRFRTTPKQPRRFDESRGD